MAEPPVVIEIKLTGAEDLARQITEATSKAVEQFSKMGDGATKASRDMEKLTTTMQRVRAEVNFAANQFGNAIQAAERLGASYNRLEAAATRVVRNTTLIVGALAGVATAFGALAISAIKSADDIKDQADALGLSVRRYKELSAAAADAGISNQQFNSAFGRFQQQVDAHARAASQSLLSFVETTKKKPHPNIRDVEPIVTSFKTIQEAVKNVRADLEKRGIHIPLANVTEEMTRLATGTDKMQAEFERVGRVTLPTASAGLLKLREEADRGKTALERLNVEVVRGDDGAVDLNATFSAVANALAKIPDPARRASIAAQLFGRQAGPKMAALLKDGAAGIEEFVKQLGITSNLARDIKVDEASKALTALGQAAKDAKNDVGSVFAPTVTLIANEFKNVIRTITPVLEEIAGTIQSKVLPYVEAFFMLLRGEGDDDNQALQQLAAIQVKLEQFGQRVRTVFQTIVVPAFRAFMNFLDEVAKRINAIFGTQLDGQMLAIVLVVAKLTGAFGLLTAAVGFFINAARLIPALFGWPGVLLFALFELIKNFDAVTKVVKTFIDTINQTFGTKFKADADTIIQAIEAIIVAFVAFRVAVAAANAGLIILGANPILRTLSAVATLIKDISRGPEIFDENGKSLGRLNDVIGKSAEIQQDKVGTVKEEVNKLRDAMKGATGETKQNTAASKEAGAANEFWASRIRNVQQQLRENKTGGISANIREVPKAATDAKKALDDTTKSMENTTRAASKMGEDTKRAFAEVSRIEKLPGEQALTQLQEMSQTLQEEISKIGQKAGLQDERRNLVELKSFVDAAIARIPILRDELDRVRQEFGDKPLLKEVLPETTPIETFRDRFAPAIESLKTQTDAFNTSIDGTNTKLAEVGTTVTTTAGQVTANIGIFERLTNLLAAINPISSAQAATAGAPPRQGGQEGTAPGSDLLGLSQYQAAAQQIEQIITQLKEQIQQLLTQPVEGAWNWITDGLRAAFETATGIVQAFFEGLTEQFQAVAGKAQEAVQAVADSFRAIMDAAVSAIEDAARRAISALEAVIAKAREAAAAAASVGGSGGGGGDEGGGDDEGEGFVRGGRVFGRKGKDRVPAWLTEGEYVVRRSAVSRVGTAFLDALNRGSLNIPRFNLGGLAEGIGNSLSMPAPIRMATGGLVSAGASTNGGDTFWIGVPGVGRIGPMRGAPGVAEQLQRASIKSTLSSGGRSPRGGA